MSLFSLLNFEMTRKFHNVISWWKNTRLQQINHLERWIGWYSIDKKKSWPIIFSRKKVMIFWNFFFLDALFGEFLTKKKITKKTPKFFSNFHNFFSRQIFLERFFLFDWKWSKAALKRLFSLPAHFFHPDRRLWNYFF